MYTVTDKFLVAAEALAIPGSSTGFSDGIYKILFLNTSQQCRPRISDRIL